jgi:DNA-directed RNA polymerase subunit F
MAQATMCISCGVSDARLDREAHAGLELMHLALDHVRRLVRREPDAMPRAVEELRAVAGVGDDAARRAVDLLARDARPDRLAWDRRPT